MTTVKRGDIFLVPNVHVGNASRDALRHSVKSFFPRSQRPRWECLP